MSIYQGDQKVANNITIENASYSVPIGTIISYASTTLPIGFLLCDGSEISKTDYADLYIVIGNKFGTATDTTKFKLPDLRNRFIQGANGNLGASKDAGLPNITGTFYHDTNAKAGLSGAFASYESTGRQNLANDPPTNSGLITFDASKSNSIYGNSDTVQPPSVCLTFIIKAEKVGAQYTEAVGALIDDTSVNSNKVWSSQKINEANSNLDLKKANQLGINLARSENVIKTSTQEATKVENDDGTITITPAVSYGRYNVYVNIEPSDKVKYYYVAYKFKADSYTKNSPAVYAFTGSTTNLGTVTAVQGNLTSKNDDYGYRCRSFIFRTSVAQSTANVLQMGIITNTNVPYTIQPNPFVVVDVTDLYSDKSDNTDLMNFTSLFGFDHYDSADITNKAICNVAKRISNIEPVSSNWDGKNAIVIGDSITAAGKWQTKLTDMLGITVTTHAKGGVGAVAMVDGDGGTLNPLSTDDVSNKDLIIVLPAYNNRGKPDGVVGDCYSPDGTGQDTIAGIIQYTINRIYDTLKDANNLKCKILYATPHCAGKYLYNDVDGYGEYPAGTGRTMETLGNTIIAVCNHNNIPVCDLWHNSGINKFTWDIFGANANAVNSQYSPYELDASGNPTSNTRIKYVKGQSYYQIRDGEVVLEEYTDSAPYPYNGDQLHCCDDGYARIGECIVGSIIEHYGN